MPNVKFQDIHEPTPRFEDVAAEYKEIRSALEAAGGPAERLEAVRAWDRLRRRLATWRYLTNLRFHQDTRNEEYKKAREYGDELQPKLVEMSVDMERTLLASPHRAEMEAELGKQAFDLWECSVTTYDPAIEEEMVQESKLEAEYTELLASARLEFQGKTYNLSGILKFREHPDRATRHSAETVRWNWFRDNGDGLDRIYGDLVGVRARMARKLGFDDYVTLGYRRMSRIDYGREEVERYRAVVLEHVVPLASELRRLQAADLDLDRLMFWDESVHDPRGNPAPRGDHDWLLERAQEMFDAMGGGLDGFFRLMVESDLLDLKTREGKAGGGFCTNFPSVGLPYIFANFNGTKGDVEVFTHEMGHAFQDYMSREQPLFEYLFPTIEACEIHSMSLEYLTWPHMEKFFGEDADRFRRTHLLQSLLFLPYGVAVDHFQHLVYEKPDAGPADRHAMWQEMERTYMPWRDYGDLERPARGGLWQCQGHIYQAPFYYIDYTLASVCALQFWVRAEEDRDEAMRAYVTLCSRGGVAPFQELARSAGLASPFEDGALPRVVGRAKQFLGV